MGAEDGGVANWAEFYVTSKRKPSQETLQATEQAGAKAQWQKGVACKETERWFAWLEHRTQAETW